MFNSGPSLSSIAIIVHSRRELNGGILVASNLIVAYHRGSVRPSCSCSFILCFSVLFLFFLFLVQFQFVLRRYGMWLAESTDGCDADMLALNEVCVLLLKVLRMSEEKSPV